jgi:uncharacterized membrane protein
MTTVWITIAVLAAGTAAIKASGPLALGGRTIPPRALGVIALLAPAVLAALVVAETFGRGADGGLTVDARAAGLAVAAAALLARAPMLAVVGLAAATTAALRLIG